MTAPSRMKNAENEAFGRPRKSVAPAISAELTFADTNQHDFITYAGGVEVANGGAWLDIGNAPGIDVLVAWTHKTTPAVLTVIASFANPADPTVDPTVYAPPPQEASGDVASGVVTTYPLSFTIDKAKWTTTTSPGSTSAIKYARAYIRANGCRLVKFTGSADSATGSPTAHVEVSLGTIA